VNIVHVDTSTEWRGGQRQLQLLARGLAERGHRQRLVCVPGSPLARALPELEQLPARPDNSPLNLPLLAGLEADVLAAHTSHAHGLLVLAGKRPVVHRRVDFRVSGGPKYRRARAFVCVSQAVVDALVACGVPAGICELVHDGVEALPRQPPAELGEGRVVLAVGALVDHKDHATLARAAEGLPARVLVAGEGPLRAQLEGSALELLGQRSDVAALHARAAVFVHSSKEEGMGQAVVEALLSGLPVVATAAGGVPEVLAGLTETVPVGDAAALHQALLEALAGAHPSSDACIQRGLRFSVPRMVEATERAYGRSRPA
jgi:glycosyltransferase involved in cell wall biosynthesis